MTVLTCEKCQTQYNLTPEKIGAGRTVRCVACGHAWFQLPETPPAPAEPSVPPPAKSIQDSIEALLEKDEAELGAMVAAAEAEVVPEPEEAAPPAPEPAPVPEAPAQPDIPPAAVEQVMEAPVHAPAPEPPPAAIITHNPFGVGAQAFGALVFVALLSVTLIFFAALQKPLLSGMPRTVALYNALGFSPTPPGEGLRIDDIAAEQRVESKDGGLLVVSGKIVNMSREVMAYPTLTVELKNRRRKLVKTWTLEASPTKLASGESAPLMLQLKDAPRDGVTVEVRVSHE